MPLQRALVRQLCKQNAEYQTDGNLQTLSAIACGKRPAFFKGGRAVHGTSSCMRELLDK